MSELSFPLIRRFRTAGTNEGPAHVFYNNNYVLERTAHQSPVTYRLPSFSSATGTYDFYGSDPNSTFVIYTNPSLFLVFTGNTDVITSDTRFISMVHELYKVHNDDILSYRRTGSSEDWQKVRDSLSVPIVSYSAITTAITSAYTFSLLPEQFVKPDGGFTEEIFEDRAEYFLNVRFVFSGEDQSYSASTSSGITATTLTMNTLDASGAIISRPYSGATQFISNDVKATINTGAWSGMTVYGLFFTCFQPPSMPIVQFPFVATSITESRTFTPTFNFSNVEDGDSFVLEVTYDIEDTGFTNSNSFSGVTQYPREKTEDSLEQTVDKTNTVDVVGSERTATLRTRRINTPIRPNSVFLYRIGNVKTLNNIFDVEQTVITYSDFLTGATSANESMRLYIDSKSVTTPAEPTNTEGSKRNGIAPASSQGTVVDADS